MDRQQDLDRIGHALDVAEDILRGYTPGSVEAARKVGGDPVTEADLEIDRALRKILLRDGEGILTEESTDDASRLEHSRVWIVDPVDGTKEFVTGVPEWCVSVGLVEDGVPVAGGILNPAAGHRFLGAMGSGITLNGEPVGLSPAATLEGARVLASRSEIKRGEWKRFEDTRIRIVPCGSVAYKLAMVSAGLAEATWTLVPKNEWDVAGGAALVLASGGEVRTLDWSIPRFNRENVLFDGFVASSAHLVGEIREFLDLGI